MDWLGTSVGKPLNWAVLDQADKLVWFLKSWTEIMCYIRVFGCFQIFSPTG